jgi:deoxyadenosine/deoxycytidine kinase
LPKPDLILYLHSNVSRLQQNIQKRGRDYEQDISDNYLLDIQNKYFDFFKKQSDYPVLIVDVSDKDFVTDTYTFDKLVSLTEQSYEKGIHRIII